jgi:hypothetical protein
MRIIIINKRKSDYQSKDKIDWLFVNFSQRIIRPRRRLARSLTQGRIFNGVEDLSGPLLLACATR